MLENKIENQEVNVLDNLKGNISSGYVVSGQYSSRKIDNRTSIEYPMSLHVNIVGALGDVIQILNIQKSSIQAFQTQYISENEFHIEMIPTLYQAIEVKEIIEKYVQSVRDKGEDIPHVDKLYIQKIGLYLQIVSQNINDFNIKEVSEEKTIPNN